MTNLPKCRLCNSPAVEVDSPSGDCWCCSSWDYKKCRLAYSTFTKKDWITLMSDAQGADVCFELAECRTDIELLQKINNELMAEIKTLRTAQTTSCED